jgi:xanthine dehydrogenase FAD-binding subunit
VNRNVFLPETLPELLELVTHYPDAVLYAGGTDILVQLRAGTIAPPALICLERITALRFIREQKNHLVIGACTRLTDILESSPVAAHLPVLRKAVRVLGSPLIRHTATIGGNICTASPAGDSLPALTILDAVLELHTSEGARRSPLHEFILGPGRTARRPGEILTAIEIPKPAGFNIHHFEKVGQRSALAISITSFAALLHMSDSGVIEDARLAWGSVGPTIVTSKAAENALIGNRLNHDVLTHAAAIARAAVSPIDDIRAGALYRRQVSGNLMLRLSNYHPATTDTRHIS